MWTTSQPRGAVKRSAWGAHKSYAWGSAFAESWPTTTVESSYTYVRVAAAALEHEGREHWRTEITLWTLPAGAAVSPLPRRPLA